MKKNMKKNMKKKLIAASLIAALTGISCALSPVIVQAAPLKHTAKTANAPASAPTQYRAQCGMIYSAAEAKKDRYICPMDGKTMTALKTATQASRPHQPRKG